MGQDKGSLTSEEKRGKKNNKQNRTTKQMQRHSATPFSRPIPSQSPSNRYSGKSTPPPTVFIAEHDIIEH